MNYPAPPRHRVFSFGSFTLLPERQMLINGNEEVRIGGRAMDLLTALVERAGQLVTKGELIARVWPTVTVGDSNLKVNMAGLRRILGEGLSSTKYIVTMTGEGYRFVAPVVISEASAPAPAPASAVAGKHNLPIATTRIVGRADDIDAIGQEMGRTRVVSIVGPGGIGKTTVALAVAKQAIGSFRDGVRLVDFAPLTEPYLVPNTVATAVGLWVQSANTQAGLCRFLSDREMLLVLDNCEHQIEAIRSCVDPILTAASGVKIVATCREPLRIQVERVYRLPGLATPPQSLDFTVENVLPYAAIQLFVNRATDRVESFKLSDADARIAADICRRLDGIALAIELAAMRVDVYGVEGLQRQLGDRFRLLAGRRGGLERHRALAATLDWSYDLLPTLEAALLRAISVHPGQFDLNGAIAVCSLTPSETANGLAELAAKSLVSVDTECDEAGYRLPETTRAYCLEKLREGGEEQSIRRRHAAYICGVLERAAGDWAHTPARDWAYAYGRYLDALRAALDWLGGYAEDPSLGIRLTVGGSLLWNHFSLTEECCVRVSNAVDRLEAAGLIGSAAEMQLQQSLAGAIIFLRGPEPEAMDALRRALDIACQIGDADYQLRCLRTLSTYQAFRGEYEAAIRTVKTFLSIAEAEDTSAVPFGEIFMAAFELFLGQLVGARRRLERFYGHHSEGTNDPRLARFLSDGDVDAGIIMSHIYWLMGFPDTAMQTMEATIEFARNNEHELSVTNALAFACLTFLWSGRNEDCDRYVAMLDDRIVRHGLVLWRPVASFCRGALACARSGIAEAGVETLERAISECSATQHYARLPYYLGVLADAFARCGRLIDAATTIQAAVDRAYIQNEAWCVPELLRIRAHIKLFENKADDAEALLIESMASAQKSGTLSWRLRTAIDLAQLWHSQSRTGDAIRVLQPVYNEFTEGFETRDLTRAADILAKLTFDPPADATLCY